MYQRVTHQAAEGVIEPVVQCESLHHLKKRGVVKATGVSGDKLIHAMFLSSVSVYPANGTRERTRFRGEDISEAEANSKSSSQHRNTRVFFFFFFFFFATFKANYKHLQLTLSTCIVSDSVKRFDVLVDGILSIFYCMCMHASPYVTFPDVFLQGQNKSLNIQSVLEEGAG